MHEVSLCRDLISMVEDAVRESSVSRIKRIHLRLGAFSHVQADAIKFCFQAVATGTLAEGAELMIHRSESVGQCEQCLHRQSVTSRFESCCACGYFPLSVEQAEDMILQSIEVL